MITTLLQLASISAVLAEKGEGFISFPVTRQSSKSSSPDLPSVQRARTKTNLTGEASNDVTLYMATIELGSPGQSQQVQLDTGSSDLWVWGNNSGATGNTYNPEQSSDSEYVSDGFSVSYLGGNGNSGDFYTDNFSWNNIDVDLQFGVATNFSSGDSSNGILGLGWEANSSTNKTGPEGQYANLPIALKNAGYIETVAYSVFLNDYDATEGSVLFGAIDTSKFHGNLTVLSPFRDLAPFKINGSSSKASFDTGTSFTYIPDDILNRTIETLWKDEIFYDNSAQIYRRQEGQDRPEGTVTFTFNDVDINLGKEELWIKFTDNSWCLDLLPASNVGLTTSLLGDSFLRSAYVVYDLENDQLGIAPANYNGGDSNFEVIANGTIPTSQ